MTDAPVLVVNTWGADRTGHFMRNDLETFCRAKPYGGDEQLKPWWIFDLPCYKLCRNCVRSAPQETVARAETFLANLDEWDRAVAFLIGARVIQVEAGESERGEQEVWVYLDGGGAVRIIAEGVRDPLQPFEHGARFAAEFLRDAQATLPYARSLRATWTNKS